MTSTNDNDHRLFAALALEADEKQFEGLHRLLSRDAIAVRESLSMDVEARIAARDGTPDDVEIALRADQVPVRPDFVDGVMTRIATLQEESTCAGIDRLLAADRVASRPGFAAALMRDLPVAPWEKQSRRPWAIAAAAAVALVTASVLLLGGRPESSLAGGLLEATFAMFSTTLAAGGGFLAASWGGLRSTVGESLQSSPGSIVALAAMTASVGGILFSLVRRRRRSRATVAERRD